MFWLARRVNANLAQQENETQKSGSGIYKPPRFGSRKLIHDRNRYGTGELLTHSVKLSFSR